MRSAATSAWRGEERLDLPRKRLETLYELYERLSSRFDRDDLLRLMEELPGIAITIAQTLSHRLRELSDKL